MNLNNSKIVITGAASGIGKDLMNILLNNYKQINIIAVDINVDAILQNPDWQFYLNKNVFAFCCDVSNENQMNDLFIYALEKINGVDIFIANAGFGYYELIQNADWQHNSKIFEVNVLSPIYSLQKMKEINKDKPYKVVMTVSAISQIEIPGFALYGATKAALHHFAKAYRWECKDKGQLLTVYPISTKTNFFNKNQVKPFPVQTSKWVANSIITGIEKDKTEVYPSGLYYWLMKPLNAVFPKLLSFYKLYYLKKIKQFSKIK